MVYQTKELAGYRALSAPTAAAERPASRAAGAVAVRTDPEPGPDRKGVRRSGSKLLRLWDDDPGSVWTPAPLLRILDEWSNARSHASGGGFHGRVAYDDPIVLTALSGMTGGTEFRHVFFSVKIGGDGYVHSIRVTGATADGSKSVIVTARLFGFGRPVRVTPPREGTFIDQKLPVL